MSAPHELKGHHPHAAKREAAEVASHEAGRAFKTHHEEDALSITVWPEEGVEIHALEKAIQALHIPNVTWADKFITEEVGYGIKTLVVGCVIKDNAVDTNLVQEQVAALHDHGKKLVKSVQFNAYNRMCM